ncbi:MAG: hypothetical protein ACE5GG_00605 [Candidatus Omnitrophota bacterium]
MRKIAVMGVILSLAVANIVFGYDYDSFGRDYDREGRFALSLKAGTLGGGAEGVLRLTRNINARLGVNAFQYTYSGTESDVKYDLDLNLLSFSGLVDWFPFSGSFHLSGGALVNRNKLDLTAQSAASYIIGNTTYTSAQLGTLTGELDFKELAPYAGIGWGNPFGREGRWTFVLDLGVMFQGAPNVSLSADGSLSGNAAFQADLAREEENLEDEIGNFEFYPVASFGITYRF